MYENETGQKRDEVREKDVRGTQYERITENTGQGERKCPQV